MAHILLIEPNTLLAQMYTQALGHAGHSVAHVTGAQAAIDAADAQTPDLVILELQLPQHSGIEFLHEFRSYSEWRPIPVVALAASARLCSGAAAQVLKRDLGVQEILYKPRVSLQEMVRLAREHTIAA